jgi:hypothetical protein
VVVVLPFRLLSIAGLEPHDAIGLLDQFGVMGAHQHQPLPGALQQDRPHPLGRFRIEEGGGFIEHFHGAIPQPGPQQAEAMDFAAGEMVERQGQGIVDSTAAIQ